MEAESNSWVPAAASSCWPDGRRFLCDSIMRRDAGHGGDEDRRSVYASAVAPFFPCATFTALLSILHFSLHLHSHLSLLFCAFFAACKVISDHKY